MVSELQEWLPRQADVPADTAPRQGAITCEERETEAGQDLARGGRLAAEKRECILVGGPEEQSRWGETWDPKELKSFSMFSKGSPSVFPNISPKHPAFETSLPCGSRDSG